MEDNENWRARRAAELIGTPFERPRDPVRDRMDETLPIQRPEPAVFGDRSAARPASPPEPVAPSRRGVPQSRWWLARLGVLVLLIAIVVASRNRKLPARAAPVAVASAVIRPTVPAPTPPVAVLPSVTRSAVVAPVADVPKHDQTSIVATASGRSKVAPPHENAAPAPAAHKTASHDAVPPAATHAKPPAHQAITGAKAANQHPTVLPIITVSVPRCTATSSRIETAICASPTLTALDRQTRELGAGVVADGDQRLIAKAQKGEASFIKKRERCKDDACLGRVYAYRIEALQKLRKKAMVEQARAAEKALPICAKGEHSSPTTCRHRRFSLKRLFGG